jgi:membrane protein
MAALCWSMALSGTPVAYYDLVISPFFTNLGMKLHFKKRLQNIWAPLKASFDDFSTYKITTLSAALSYCTIFAMAPLLIIVLWLCDLFLGKASIDGHIFVEIQSFVGTTAAAQIQGLIKSAALSKASVIASVIGIASLIIAATGLFTQIQDSINFIWQLQIKPQKGLIKLLLNRLLSFSVLIGLGFILLVSLFINTLMDAFSGEIAHFIPDVAVWGAYLINLLLTFLVISTLFGVIFKVLPDARIEWRDVRAGAIVTALLFMVGKFLISLYMSKSKVSSSYGAAGSVLIILLWVYYSSIILYFGAAFTKEYAMHNGRQIYPNDYAVFVEQVATENKRSLTMQQDPKKNTLQTEATD